jgi:peptidoglycan/xylan/chitin deacetylase (PgdA/CDA1 family)
VIKHLVPASVIRQKLDIKRSILFTFDDGPHPEITPRVLDILDQYGAKGLFFIPGIRLIKSPKLILEIVQRKHGIGNHSFNHTTCNRLSYSEIVEEITKCKEAIFSHCGVITDCYRPPEGIVTLSLLFAAWNSNHKIIKWSLDSGEYSYMKNATSYELAENFMSRIHDRAIVISHDDKDTVPDYLKLVLPRLVNEGYDLANGLHSLESRTKK